MFRREAITANRRQLHGDVFIAQPLSFRLLGLFLLFITCTALLFLTRGSYARTESVIGHLVPSRGLVKITATRAGTLDTVNVRQGDTIVRGQVIAVIRISGNYGESRPPADRAMTALLSEESELRTQVDLETNRFETETARIQAEIGETSLSISALQGRLAIHRQMTASARASFETLERLSQKGYVTKAESDRRHRAWLKLRSEEKIIGLTLAEAGSRRKLLDLRLQQLPVESKQRIARLRARIAALEGRKTALLKERREFITSSIGGRVLSLHFAGRGHTVAAGQPLLTIMPRGSYLVAELFVPSRAAGFLRRGQEVRLRFDAYPYEHFGTQQASITRISDTLLAPQELSTPFRLDEAAYRVTARPGKNAFATMDDSIVLQSGMTLRANIVLERRTLLRWLLEPLYRVTRQS